MILIDLKKKKKEKEKKMKSHLVNFVVSELGNSGNAP